MEKRPRSKKSDATFMNFSKAFHSIDHSPLMSKQSAYGFSAHSLKFILSHLKNRIQRTVLKNSYSSWEEILAGALQGSILGLFLFNIFVNGLFLLPKTFHIANYADDNALYTTRD